MKEAMQYVEAGHMYWTLWARVEGLDELWVQRSFPYSEVTTGYTHKAILATESLTPQAGSGNPLSGIGSASSFNFHLHDSAGYIDGLLDDGNSSQLAAEFLAADLSFDVVDASAWNPVGGKLWLPGERLEYTTIVGNTVSGLTRNHNSDEQTKDYKALPDGTIMPFRVGDTPKWLEGLTVHVYIAAIDSGGYPCHDYSESQEIWKGTITAVPYSVSGNDYTVECMGLERRLQSQVYVGESVGTIFTQIPGTPYDNLGMPLITECANEITLRAEFVVGNNEGIYQQRFTLPVGVITFQDIRNLWKIDVAAWLATIDANIGTTTSVISVWDIACVWIDCDVPLAIYALDSPRSCWRQFGHSNRLGKFIAGNLMAYQYQYFYPDRGYYTYIPAGSDIIPIMFSKPPDWPASGYFRIKDNDTVYYESFDTDDYDVGEYRLYHFRGCLRNQLGTIAKDWYGAHIEGTSTGFEVGADVANVAVISGGSAALAMRDMLITNASGPRLPTNYWPLQSAETNYGPTGARSISFGKSAAVAHIVGDVLALDGLALAPAWLADGTYGLRCAAVGDVSPAIQPITIDWDQQVGIDHGLGNVVNQLQLEVENGKVLANDLPGIALVGCAQSKSYQTMLHGILSDMLAAANAGYALMRRYGRPHLIMRASLCGQYRSLRVGDIVSVAMPRGDTKYWYVMQIRPSWSTGIAAHMQVVLHECLDADCVWYAPVGVVDSVGANSVVLETDTWSGTNVESQLYRGSNAQDCEWFSDGDKVRFYNTANGSYEDHTITTVVRATNTLNLDAVGTIVAGMRVTLQTYANESANSKARYQYFATAGTTYHEWGG